MDPFRKDGTALTKGVETAHVVGELLHAPLCAAAVVSPDQVRWPKDFASNWGEQLAELGRKALARKAKRLLPDAPVEVALQPTHSSKETALAMSKLAERSGARAIAVFTHLRKKGLTGGSSRFVTHLVSSSKVPVLAVNAQAPAIKAIRRVLFATDLSKESQRAFDQAVQLCRDTSAKLILFHSLTIPLVPDLASASSMVGGWANLTAFLENEERRTKTEGEKWVRKAKSVGIEASFVIQNGTGSIAESILKSADKNKADLIVMAETTGPVAAFFLGSVTREVLGGSKKPVLVVR